MQYFFKGLFLTRFINTLLHLDPQYGYLVKHLNNKVLSIDIKDFNVRLNFYPVENKIYITNQHTLVYHCFITGELSDLIALIMSENPQKHIQNQTIYQKGDLHVLQSYQSFFKSLDLDWEYHISQYTNKTFAYLLCKPFKSMIKWHSDSYKQCIKDLNDYLHEEKRLFPNPEEINDFYEEIYELQLAIDRVQAKIARIKSK
jgi:ubiquinone biosynthesis protein UbiJ